MDFLCLISWKKQIQKRNSKTAGEFQNQLRNQSGGIQKWLEMAKTYSASWIHLQGPETCSAFAKTVSRTPRKFVI